VLDIIAFPKDEIACRIKGYGLLGLCVVSFGLPHLKVVIDEFIGEARGIF
jgi:hypothetical protein